MNRRIASAVAAAAAVLLLVLAGSAGAAGKDCPTTNPPNELVLASGSGQQAQLGRQFQASLQVRLANTNGCAVTGNLAGIDVDFGAPGSGASGTFASSGTNHAIVGTDAQGVATAPPLTANDVAGAYGVDAISDFGSVTLTLVNVATGVPSAIAATGGSGQQADAGSAYAQPLQARVTDADNRPVAGVTVSFAVVPGPTGAGASFVGGAAAVTNANGVATSPPLQANGTAGRFAVVASVAGLDAVASFALDNHAAGTTVAAVTPDGSSAVVGGRFAAPQARVLDSGGRPLEGASVTFAVAQSAHGAGASFVGGGSQAVAVTDADGVATAPALVANTTSGDFTVTATAAGATPVVYTLRNRAGIPATASAGAASGATAAVGTRFAVPLVVTVADRYGNPVSGATVVFRAPARGASGRFLRGGRSTRTATVRTDAKGLGVAPPFAAGRTAGGYAVTATVAGTSVRAAFALVQGR